MIVVGALAPSSVTMQYVPDRNKHHKDFRKKPDGYIISGDGGVKHYYAKVAKNFAHRFSFCLTRLG